MTIARGTAQTVVLCVGVGAGCTFGGSGAGSGPALAGDSGTGGAATGGPETSAADGGTTAAADGGGTGTTSAAVDGPGTAADTTPGVEGTTGSGDGSDGFDDGPTDGDTATPGSTDGSSTDGGSTDDATTDPGTAGSSDGPAATAAQLVFSASPLDFSATPWMVAASQQIQVTNVGESPATAIAPSLSGPFVFDGGSYPGNGADCGEMLAADDSCTLALAFPATVLGPADGLLTLGYDDGEGAAEASTPLLGAATGSTANLIANPDGESCVNFQPTGWTEVLSGDWVCEGDVGFLEPFGSAMLAAGSGDDGQNFLLVQTISLADYANAIDSGQMSFSFSGSAASRDDNNDPYRIQLRYRDENANLVESYNSGWQSGNSWTEYVDLRDVHPTVREVVVRLQCDKLGGDWCDAFFDELSLVGSYD